MKKFVIQSIPLLLSILAIYMYHLSFNCLYTHCSLESFVYSLSEVMLRPLRNFALFSTLGFLALPFVSEKVFRSAIKFIVGWTIATIVLVAITQTNSNSYLPILDPEKASVALVMGALLSFITIIIVVKKSFFSKK